MSTVRNHLLSLSLSVSLALCLVQFVCPTLARAQADTGQIAGRVTDSSGAVVAGGTVTVKNAGTNAVRTTRTSAEGTYLITGLEPATYEVTVSSGSFRPFIANLEVTVGGHATLDAQLSISGTTTEVAVVAQGGAQVNTQTQELSQVVNQEQVSQLPSLSRNPYDFVAQAMSRLAMRPTAATLDPTIPTKMAPTRRAASATASMDNGPAALRCCWMAWRISPSLSMGSECMCR